MTAAGPDHGDWRATRCGHNFEIPNCPYERCVAKENAAEIARLRNPLVAGSQYLNLPTRRASDKALEVAVKALVRARNELAFELKHHDPSLTLAVRSADQAIADIEALIPGATTGEGR